MNAQTQIAAIQRKHPMLVDLLSEMKTYIGKEVIRNPGKFTTDLPKIQATLPLTPQKLKETVHINLTSKIDTKKISDNVTQICEATLTSLGVEAFTPTIKNPEKKQFLKLFDGNKKLRHSIDTWIKSNDTRKLLDERLAKDKRDKALQQTLYAILNSAAEDKKPKKEDNKDEKSIYEAIIAQASPENLPQIKKEICESYVEYVKDLFISNPSATSPENPNSQSDGHNPVVKTRTAEDAYKKQLRAEKIQTELLKFLDNMAPETESTDLEKKKITEFHNSKLRIHLEHAKEQIRQSKLKLNFSIISYIPFYRNTAEVVKGAIQTLEEEGSTTTENLTTEAIKQATQFKLIHDNLLGKWLIPTKKHKQFCLDQINLIIQNFLERNDVTDESTKNLIELLKNTPEKASEKIKLKEKLIFIIKNYEVSDERILEFVDSLIKAEQENKKPNIAVKLFIEEIYTLQLLTDPDSYNQLKAKENGRNDFIHSLHPFRRIFKSEIPVDKLKTEPEQLDKLQQLAAIKQEMQKPAEIDNLRVTDNASETEKIQEESIPQTPSKLIEIFKNTSKTEDVKEILKQEIIDLIYQKKLEDGITLNFIQTLLDEQNQAGKIDITIKPLIEKIFENELLDQDYNQLKGIVNKHNKFIEQCYSKTIFKKTSKIKKSEVASIEDPAALDPKDKKGKLEKENLIENSNRLNEKFDRDGKSFEEESKRARDQFFRQTMRQPMANPIPQAALTAITAIQEQEKSFNFDPESREHAQIVVETIKSKHDSAALSRDEVAQFREFLNSPELAELKRQRVIREEWQRIYDKTETKLFSQVLAHKLSVDFTLAFNVSSGNLYPINPTSNAVTQIISFAGGFIPIVGSFVSGVAKAIDSYNSYKAYTASYEASEATVTHTDAEALADTLTRKLTLHLSDKLENLKQESLYPLVSYTFGQIKQVICESSLKYSEHDQFSCDYFLQQITTRIDTGEKKSKTEAPILKLKTGKEISADRILKAAVYGNKLETSIPDREETKKQFEESKAHLKQRKPLPTLVETQSRNDPPPGTPTAAGISKSTSTPQARQTRTSAAQFTPRGTPASHGNSAIAPTPARLSRTPGTLFSPISTPQSPLAEKPNLTTCTGMFKDFLLRINRFCSDMDILSTFFDRNGQAIFNAIGNIEDNELKNFFKAYDTIAENPFRTMFNGPSFTAQIDEIKPESLHIYVMKFITAFNNKFLGKFLDALTLIHQNTNTRTLVAETIKNNPKLKEIADDELANITQDNQSEETKKQLTIFARSPLFGGAESLMNIFYSHIMSYRPSLEAMIKNLNEQHIPGDAQARKSIKLLNRVVDKMNQICGHNLDPINFTRTQPSPVPMVNTPSNQSSNPGIRQPNFS